MLKIIAAVTANGVIGRNGDLPFTLHSDLRTFKKLTDTLPVVMGKKTFDSIVRRLHKPLPNRENIVLTRSPHNLMVSGVTVTDNFEYILKRSEKENIFVIGGSEIYKLAMPFVDEMHLTRVHAEVEGDAFFPRWDESEWYLVSAVEYLADDKNEFSFTQEKYVRRHRFIEMSNCRTAEQREVMQEILKAGVCPFCIEHFGKYHANPVLWSGRYWQVSQSMWPYPNSRVHLILFLKEHAEKIEEVPSGAFEEIGSILGWANAKFEIKGAGFYMRSGECLLTGGTVRHIHAHYVAKDDVDGEPIKFYLGS